MKNIQCRKCANLVNNWCEEKANSPDPDLIRDCNHYKLLTYGERIRNMPFEDLAKFLADLVNGGCPPNRARICTHKGQTHFRCDPKDCWLKWLQMEAGRECICEESKKGAEKKSYCVNCSFHLPPEDGFYCGNEQSPLYEYWVNDYKTCDYWQPKGEIAEYADEGRT